MKKSPSSETRTCRRRRIGVPTALAAGLLLATVAAAREPTLRFRRISTEQGLSDSTVEAIVQDRLGFMWFGTADGLNRYDGYDFKVYSTVEDDPTSLSGNYVWDLLVDSAGVLWIGSGAGLNRYVVETDSFVSYRHDPQDESSLTFDMIQDIFEDSRGRLWLGTGGGLNRFDRSTGLSTRYLHDEADPASLSDNNVQAVFEDSGGRLWVGTRMGLDLYDEETAGFSHFRHDSGDPHSLSSDFVRAIGEDSEGMLWVGTEYGLNRMNPADPGHFVRYLHDLEDPRSVPDNLIWTIFEDSRGRLWIGTDHGGLAFYDRARDAFVAHAHDPSDPTSIGSNVVSIIYEDAVGDLWTGNYAGGVNYLDRRSTAFEVFRRRPEDPQGLPHSSVLSLAEDSRGDIWVGTEEGLARFDRADRRFTSYRHDPREPGSLSAPAVLSIYEDRAGRMWVGTYSGGLDLFDRRSGRFSRRFPDPDTDPSSGIHHINAIREDRAGNLWLGTYEGLFRIHPDGSTRAYRSDIADPATLGHDLVWAIHEDAAGRLWFATHSGLSLYDPERDAFVRLQHRPEDPRSLSFNEVLWIHEEDDGILWLGTHGGGVNRFDVERQSFTAFGEEHGLPSDVVYCVETDRSGDLWLSTNKGLARFDPDREIAFTYDEKDGLQGRQFNRGAALASSAGELYFGGIHGLNVFDPADILANPAVPPVVLTDFQIFNRPVEAGTDAALRKSIPVAERIVLDHDQSVLSLTFAALSYRSPHKNRYAYMLEGFDTDWVDADSQRTATYTNLDPGTYVFRVKAANDSGVWNHRGAAIPITVRPPYWATGWFRLASLLVGIAIIVLLYRARVRSFSERNLLLQREIDERKRAEKAQERLLQQMEESQIKLESQKAELERFAYTVSHDLKSPLVTIQGFLGVLERDSIRGDLEAVERDMRQITKATQTMAALLSQSLELARVGRVASPAEDVAFAELAREAVSQTSALIAERGVEVEIAADLPVVRCDRIRLLEVFQNLIENAVKFMGDQPRPRIEVGVRRQGEEDVCYVRDNGLGIDPSHHHRVFGLFERLSKHGEGTGIGLALVKRIIEVHGGRIWLESDGPGRGSTFCFVIPQRREGEPEESSRRRRPPAAPPHASRPGG